MKIFKFMVVALVAMVGFSSCSEDCDHEFIEYDNTKNLVGTWTYLEEGQAEAMVINSDGSFEVTGVMKGGNGSLYEEKGTIKVVNNKVSLVFEGDTDVIEGRLELVAGKSLSIVLNEEYDIRLTYNYCKEDLSDEIVGMWVSNDGPTDMENEIMIRTYDNDGKVTTTGVRTIGGSPDWILKEEREYKVVGNLLFKKLSESVANQVGVSYNVEQLIYTPKATALGDIMTVLFNLPIGDGFMQTRSSFLRVKQDLNLNGKTYNYSSAYVTNAKGKDEDFTIMGHPFNMSNIKGGNFDRMFYSDLFCLDLNATTIKKYYRFNGQDVAIEIPITVEGNKVTLDMSAINPSYRKVDMYMFQDADDSQLHMYMHTDAFINYFGNLEVITMLQGGKIDKTDTAAIEKVFADMEARIQSINVSFVMKVRK